MFFILNGLGSFKAKLKTFVGNIHNDSIGVENTILNFLIVGNSIGGREGMIKLRGAENDASIFDGTNDQIVILLVFSFTGVGVGKKDIHMYICIQFIW